MALKKKDDALDALKSEAEENGINLSRAEDGTYAASIVGGPSLDQYSDPRALLDDMLACVEMDEKDDLYAYDNGPMGGYQVAVTGNPKPFEHETLAGAFALAKESLIPPVKAKAKKTYDKVAQGPALSPNPTVQEIDEKDDVEVLAPTKPNGAEKATMARDDLIEAIATGYLDLAAQLTTMASALRAGPSTIPFVQKGFSEGEEDSVPAAPPPARSRISRERSKKEA